jgi:hypothetical protein
MSDDSDDSEEQPGRRTLCYGCGGTGLMRKPRLFVSLRTGEPDTVVELGSCPHCRDGSGSLPGIVPPL